MDIPQQIKNRTQRPPEEDPFTQLKNELDQALSRYWEIATQILHHSGITVLPPRPDYFAIEKNFFSALFLYSYFRMEIPKSRRVLYAAANQCLRGMVTGCDNILDNEYKKTLETDLPEQATRFRSVLDIMISDRVLFALLQRGYLDGDLTFDQIESASFASLRALAKSGAQEASEECGIGKILPPEEILSKIHHYKTGILFLSPWALPDVIEAHCANDSTRIDYGLRRGPRPDVIDVHCANHSASIKSALFQIGMGCQILDDMVDVTMDLQMNRHNYVISLIHHGNHPTERADLEKIRSADTPVMKNKTLLLDFPHTRKTAARTALTFLKNGTQALFAKEHDFMIESTIAMITQRIGADALLSDIES